MDPMGLNASTRFGDFERFVPLIVARIYTVAHSFHVEEPGQKPPLCKGVYIYI